MGLTNTLIIAFALVFLIVGLHQSIINGLKESYWIFMLCISMLFLYKYRTMKASEQQEQQPQKGRKKPAAKRKKGSK